MEKIIKEKIKNYINIANKAGYIIFGADNLKHYTHKLYLIIYREDGANTIIKTIKYLETICQNIFKLTAEDMIDITMADNCKLLAIKNKGIADKIIEILRSEQIGK